MQTKTGMDPQTFCCLPWCGRSYGGPMKVRIIDGQRLEYPEQIDAHHIYGRHQGPVAYICHVCHMEHHQGGFRLHFTEDNETVLVRNPSGHYVAPRIAQPWD